MSNLLRVAVSKQKRRYQKNGYDLDLAYITDNIIAMGFPSEKVEGVFRNPMKDVQRFLDQYHKDHYKVYNLCSERVYDHSKFYGRVGYFPFDDHNAPAFEVIESFCKDVDQWMKEDSKNIAVIHCKAGKGRTGLMICCWLMYCGMWKNTEDSLRFYAALRTYNQKGVTIPSQIRYVNYFGKALRENIKYVPKTVLLRKILLKPLPKEINLSEVQFNISVGKTMVFSSKDNNINVTIHKTEKKKKEISKKDIKKKEKKLTKENSEAKLNGEANNNNGNPQSSSPNLSSSNGGGTISSSSGLGMNTISSNSLYQLGGSQFNLNDLADSGASDEYISFEIGSVPLLGDVRIEFTSAKDDRMFMFWVNTSFVQQVEVIGKSGLDKAHKDKNHKTYPEDFHVELYFETQLEQTTTVVASADETTTTHHHHHEHHQHQQNNIATSTPSSSHNDISVSSDNNNTNNNNTNTNTNNISLSSSQSNPIVQQTSTPTPVEQPIVSVPVPAVVINEPTQVEKVEVVEAEKVENSNAIANDSNETSSESSSDK